MSCQSNLSANVCNNNEYCKWKGIFCNPTSDANTNEYTQCIQTNYQKGTCTNKNDANENSSFYGNQYNCSDRKNKDLCVDNISCNWDESSQKCTLKTTVCPSFNKYGKILCESYDKICEYTETKSTCDLIGNCAPYPLYYDLSNMTTQQLCENNTIEYCDGNDSIYEKEDCTTNNGTWKTISGSWDGSKCIPKQNGNTVNDICTTASQLCKKTVNGNLDIPTSLTFGVPNINCSSYTEQECSDYGNVTIGGNTINLCMYVQDSSGNSGTCKFNTSAYGLINFYSYSPQCKQINMAICSEYNLNPNFCDQLGGYCQYDESNNVSGNIITKDICENELKGTWVTQCSYNNVTGTCSLPLQLYKTTMKTLSDGPVHTMSIVSSNTLSGFGNTKGTNSFVPFKKQVTNPNVIYIKLYDSSDVKIASNNNQIISSKFNFNFVEVKATYIMNYTIGNIFKLETDSKTQLVHIKNTETGGSVPIYTNVNKHAPIPPNMVPIIQDRSGKWIAYYSDKITKIDSEVLKTFPNTPRPKKSITYILAWVFGIILLLVLLVLLVRNWHKIKKFTFNK